MVNFTRTISHRGTTSFTTLQECSYAPDGTRIPHYKHLKIDEILPPHHRRIQEDWRSYKRLEPYSYCPLDLINFLHVVIGDGRPPREDRRFVAQGIPLHRHLEEIRFHLNAWFHVFNKWFFGEQLNLRLQVVPCYPPGPAGTLDLSNMTLSIYDTCIVDESFTGTIDEYWVNALLRLMVRAFTQLYSCRKKGCCATIHEDPSLGGLGRENCGPAYFDYLCEVSDELSWHTKMYVNPCVHDVVAHSIRTQIWQPSVDQLERWSMDVDFVDYWRDISNWHEQLASRDSQTLIP